MWQVVLKRLMLRCGDAIAQRYGALALVTGEAIGQVSSQTIENPAAIESGSPIPVLRPLLGFDKDEIVDLARRVGTYDLSAKVPEYCALHGRAPATAVSAAERTRAAGMRAHYFAGGTGKLLKWAAGRQLVDPTALAPAVREG